MMLAGVSILIFGFVGMFNRIVEELRGKDNVGN